MRIAFIALVAVFLAAVLLEKTLRGIPAKELRRLARARHTKKADAVYKLAAFGASSRVFLWLVGALSAGGIVLYAADTAWWLGLAAVFITWLLWMSRPISRPGGIRWYLAAWLSSLFSPVISFLQPLLGRLADWLKINRYRYPSGLYEKEDLLELMKIQGRQADNRITKEDLQLAAGALSFSDKTVGSVMMPRRKVKWVAASDPVGPMIADELHQSGQNCFPVVKEVTKAARPEVVGTLHIKDLVEHLESKGRIRDIMKPGSGYINEAQSLPGSISVFLESGSNLLIVVNNFEEIVGVLSLENTLKQIFGDSIPAEAEHYDDIRAAASHETKQSDSKEMGAGVE